MRASPAPCAVAKQQALEQARARRPATRPSRSGQWRAGRRATSLLLGAPAVRVPWVVPRLWREVRGREHGTGAIFQPSAITYRVVLTQQVHTLDPTFLFTPWIPPFSITAPGTADRPRSLFGASRVYFKRCTDCSDFYFVPVVEGHSATGHFVRR